MDSEMFSRSGKLNAALELVQHELPMNLSTEEQSRLAIEVYKAQIGAEAVAYLTSAVERLVTTLEATTLSSNRD